jgi:hypothetical protein
MSSGFIYVVDAHFSDKIEEKKSWTQIINFDFQTSWNLRFWVFSIDASGEFQASFMISWFNRFILSEKFCKQVLFFDHRGHLQALKVCSLKLWRLSQLCGLKDRMIEVGI